MREKNTPATGQSKTPRTDAELIDCGHDCGVCHHERLHVPADLARTLETELSAALAEIERLKAPPEIFEFAWYEWTRHTPGDPIPCSDDWSVNILIRDELQGEAAYSHEIVYAGCCNWGHAGNDSIVGWRAAE